MPTKRTAADTGLLPWERQKGESAQAFEAFSIYRDLGSERSQQAVAKQLCKSRQLLARWSAQWEWVERARAYDIDLDRQARVQSLKDAKDMRRRQTKTGVFMQKKALEALEKLKPDDLDVNSIIRLITEGAKLESSNRLAEIGYGQSSTGTPARPGQNGQTESGIDWSKLSEEDLEKLARMDGGDDDGD